ncbi:BT1A1 protein, partial [Rissa tridactyla]|nr:BT1A1 protein [Rissa tridactyla]
ESRWGFGVARESVERKRFSYWTPEGGIWAVRYCYGDFVSLTSHRTFLPQSPLPSRVWVCL